MILLDAQQLPGAEALAVARQFVDHPDPETRIWAADCLAAISDVDVREEITRMFGDVDGDVRGRALLSALDREYADLLPTYETMLRADCCVDVRTNAAIAIGRFGTADSEPLLRQSLQLETDATARIRLVEACILLRYDVNEVRQLLSFLQAEDAAVRIVAADALLSIARPENIEDLIGALDEAVGHETDHVTLGSIGTALAELRIMRAEDDYGLG